RPGRGGTRRQPAPRAARAAAPPAMGAGVDVPARPAARHVRDGPRGPRPDLRLDQPRHRGLVRDRLDARRHVRAPAGPRPLDVDRMGALCAAGARHRYGAQVDRPPLGEPRAPAGDDHQGVRVRPGRATGPLSRGLALWARRLVDARLARVPALRVPRRAAEGELMRQLAAVLVATSLLAGAARAVDTPDLRR